MRNVVILAALAMVLDAASARACECVATPIYRSDPVEGATDVALNQALMIEGVFAPASVKLLDDRGQAVPFELNAGPWPGCPGTSADVLPREPLKPNASYVLRVEALLPEAVAEGAKELHFTTGTRSLPDETLAPPRIRASVLRDAPVAMCGIGQTTFACIGPEAQDGVELIMRRGEQILLRTTTLVQADGLYSLTDVPDCIELRRRARTGKRSAPVSVCGEALEVRAWTKADSPGGSPACHDGAIGAAQSGDGGVVTATKDDGCALSRSSSPYGLLLVALALLRKRRLS